MFDFLDNDWFIITLEIIFLILIIYDIKKYKETKKKEYITNIILTIGFAIWTLYPFYHSYFEWTQEQKNSYIEKCNQENNETFCKCLSKSTFLEYSFEEFTQLDKKNKEYEEFFNEVKEDCFDNGWF